MGVTLEIIVKGDGKNVPKPGQTVCVHYTGFVSCLEMKAIKGCNRWPLITPQKMELNSIVVEREASLSSSDSVLEKSSRVGMKEWDR